MNFLTLEGVSKSYGEKLLFSDLDLHIGRGDKVALVAQNGTGKTSLLRVIAGEEEVEGEQAKIIVAKDIRLGYLKQEPLMYEKSTALETIYSGESDMLEAIRKYEEALLKTNEPELMQSAIDLMELYAAWDFEAKIKEVLFKLGITDLSQEVGTMSGGQKKRLALAKLLIDDPDFLIMDEPTNHLDLEMIEWLEEYLSQARITLFMVTHDRYFLERVCNVIVELDRGKLYKYHGNYTDFLLKKTARQENEMTLKDKAAKLMRKELDWLNRQPKARTTKAKSRIQAFDDIKNQANVEVGNETLVIEMKGARLGSKIVECHNISKTYGEKALIKDFNYKFKRNEKVGIIGNNGMGKSTLVKLMTKEIRPDTGKVVVGETVEFGYYGQSGIQLKDDKRVINVITDIAEFIPLTKGQKLTAASLLERFMFDRKKQQVYVSQLSGGERRRLYLLTVLMKNPNFLILDEPTNDLDIITLNVLEEWLQSFKGTVVIVSHDRFFMDKLTDHLFIFEGQGKIRDYNGTYSHYRNLKKQEGRINPQSEEIEVKKNTKHQQIHAAQGGLSHQKKKELKRLERKLNKLEEKKTMLHKKFEKVGSDPEQLAKLGIELKSLNEELEDTELLWMNLVDEA